MNCLGWPRPATFVIAKSHVSVKHRMNGLWRWFPGAAGAAGKPARGRADRGAKGPPDGCTPGPSLLPAHSLSNFHVGAGPKSGSAETCRMGWGRQLGQGHSPGGHQTSRGKASRGPPARFAGLSWGAPAACPEPRHAWISHHLSCGHGGSVRLSPLPRSHSQEGVCVLADVSCTSAGPL